MSVTYKSERKRSVAECRRLREVHACPRSCDFWNVHRQGKFLPFCPGAHAAEFSRK